MSNSDFLVLRASAARTQPQCDGYSSDGNDGFLRQRKRVKKARAEPKPTLSETLDLLSSEESDSDDDSPRRSLTREEALDRMLKRLVATAEHGAKRSRRPAARLDYTRDMQRSKVFPPSAESPSKPDKPRKAPEPSKAASYDDRGSSAADDSESESESGSGSAPAPAPAAAPTPAPAPAPEKLPVANASWRRPRVASASASASMLPPKKRAPSPPEEGELIEVIEVLDDEEDYTYTVRRRAEERERGP